MVDIKQDISRKLEGRRPQITATDCPQPHLRRGTRTDRPIAQSDTNGDSKMVLGSGKVMDTKVLTPSVDSHKESEYFWAQDRKQNEAKLNELKEDMSKNQEQLGIISQEKTKLEEQLTVKEIEETRLQEKIDNLRLAEDTLKLKCAHSEKNKAEVNAAISALKVTVTEIVTERKKIQDQLKCFETEFNDLRAGQDKTKNEVRRVLQMQISLDTKLEQVQASMKDNKAAQQQHLYFPALLAVAIILILLFIKILW